MDESTLLTLAAEQEAAAWKRSNDEWLRQATWLAQRVAALEAENQALRAALAPLAALGTRALHGPSRGQEEAAALALLDNQYGRLTVGDVRRAQAALQGDKEG